MFYLSDVEAGGETFFSSLEVDDSTGEFVTADSSKKKVAWLRCMAPAVANLLTVYVQECKIYDCDEDETEMNVHNLRCCCRESAKVKPRSELASLPFYLASGLERNTCCMLAGKVPGFSFFPPCRTGQGTYLLTMQAAQS